MENPPNFDGMKPRKDGDFHGRTVSLPEGKDSSKKNITLPKTNISPENRPSQKERIVFQPSIFQVPC